MDSKTLQLDSPLGTAKPGKSSEWQVRINGKQFVVNHAIRRN